MRNKLYFAFTSGLYFPAVVGTGFTLLLDHVSLRGTLGALAEVESLFAIALLVIFSVSYAHAVRMPDTEYGVDLFALDMVEALLIWLAFHYLNLAGTAAPNWLGTYLALAAALTADEVWTWLTPRKYRSWVRAGLRYGGILLCLSPWLCPNTLSPELILGLLYLLVIALVVEVFVAVSS